MNTDNISDSSSYFNICNNLIEVEIPEPIDLCDYYKYVRERIESNVYLCKDINNEILTPLDERLKETLSIEDYETRQDTLWDLLDFYRNEATSRCPIKDMENESKPTIPRSLLTVSMKTMMEEKETGKFLNMLLE